MPDLASRLRGVAAWLAASFAGERQRWSNWLPVLIGIGIALYFSLPAEPPVWSGPAAFAVGLGLLFPLRRHPRGALCALALLAVAAGYMAAILRSHDVAAPRIGEEMPPRDISGRVESVEIFNPKHYRMTLEEVAIADFAAGEVPARIRLTVRLGDPPPVPGDRVSLRGGLFPPAGPAAPGAYDFGRRAWFERLGGLGYAVTTPIVEEQGTPGWRTTVSQWRYRIAEKLRAGAPGQRGAVAAAIITGDRSGIAEPVAESLRLSGIAHLLAISGLHLGLVSGIFFYLARAGLAAVPSLALRYPIKKWAAALAILAGGAYTVLAGMPIPTERAFLMTALVLLAVILDRTAISMRLVAVAATAILLTAPEALLGVSFQMSFAAVVALIAFYEGMRDRAAAEPEKAARVPRWVLYLGGLSLTSIIAGFATGLYGAYQFYYFANYGLITNLIAVPVMAFWVMPWAVAVMILLPFGLESWGLVLMGWGIDGIIWAAQTVSAWPGAVWRIPAFGTGALCLMTLGGLWLALWRMRWRYLGVALVLLGAVIGASERQPDMLINDDASMIAFQTPEGDLAINTGRGSRIVRETWLERRAATEFLRWKDLATAAGTGLDCDDWGCVYQQGRRIAMPTTRHAIAEDCRYADLVIAPFPLPRDCRPPLGRVDRFDVWRAGAHALWFSENGLRIKTVGAYQGDRPWGRRADQ